MAKGDWWIKFEIHKWLNDPKCRQLSRANRDSWLTALCMMRLDGSDRIEGTQTRLSNQLGLTLTEFFDFFHDLEDSGVADVTRCHGDVTHGHEIFTIISRRFQKELSIKEKNKLRKQKEREGKDVTPESHPISKEKEVKSKKKEEKEEEPAPEIVVIFNKAFPNYHLTIFQQETMLDRVKDEKAWTRAVAFWASNNYRPQSIGKLCDYYDEILEGKHDGTNQSTANSKRSTVEKLEDYAEVFDNYPSESEITGIQ